MKQKDTFKLSFSRMPNNVSSGTLSMDSAEFQILIISFAMDGSSGSIVKNSAILGEQSRKKGLGFKHI